MKIPLLKRMMNSFYTHLTEYGFLIVILGCFLTGFGAFVQYHKDKKADAKEISDAKEALATEKRRVMEHDILQKRSNIILGRTKRVLIDTKNLLEDTEGLLDKSEKQLAIQNDILKEQAVVIKSISGGDGVPKIILEVADPLMNDAYMVRFYVENTDDYAIQNLKILISGISYDIPEAEDPNADGATRRLNFENESKRKLYRQYSFPQLSSGANEHLDNTLLRFDAYFVDYSIKVSWLKGSYELDARLTLKDFYPNENILLRLPKQIPQNISGIKQDYFKMEYQMAPRDIIKNKIPDRIRRNMK